MSNSLIDYIYGTHENKHYLIRFNSNSAKEGNTKIFKFYFHYKPVIILKITIDHLKLLAMKILFKILDYLTAVIMGTGTLFLVNLAVNKDWNMVFAMFVGMMVGTGVLLLSLLLFSSFSTLFEIFPKGMIITMVTGMASGMVAAIDALDFAFMVSAAAVFSACAQLGFDLYNMKLQGEVPVDKE